MNHPVLLKGNSIGLTMVLDPEMKFEQLKAAICEKFIQAKDFFNGQTQIALKIEGRKLTSQQLEEVLGIIAEKTTLTVAYVIEDDKVMETSFKEALKKLEEKEQKRSQSLIDERRKGDGQFYRGTLRSGQSLESDGSVVVVGDVNPGASVSAKGNVVVLGCAKGYLSAGTVEMISICCGLGHAAHADTHWKAYRQEVQMENRRRRKNSLEDPRTVIINRWKHRLHLLKKEIFISSPYQKRS